MSAFHSLGGKGSPLHLPALFAVLVLVSYFALEAQTPSADAYSSPEPTKFQRDNAYSHLTAITRQPHFTGSEAIPEVRNYLIKTLEDMGLEVEVQSTLVGSPVHNIITRIQGEKPLETGNKALLLLSHYDSAAPWSYGASDAGSGIVTILETVRAYLQTHQQSQNDIVIVFSDGEEQGLLGAQAFVDEHPWAKSIGLVINFEARGSGGPGYMLLETNHGNAELIRHVQLAAPRYPVTDSMAYSIYKLLPNDTDLTVFRERADIPGVNFAFIDDHFDYHTPLDIPERLDKETLNHQASYLEALLPYFANADLSNMKTEQDWVFFSVFSRTLVAYPYDLAIPLWLLALGTTLAVYGAALKTRKLTLANMASQSIPAVFSVLVAVAIGLATYPALTLLQPDVLEMWHGFPYRGHWLTAAAIALTLGFTTAVYHGWCSRYKPKHITGLYFAPVVLWLALNLGLALKLTGGSFYIIPALAALLTCVVSLFLQGRALPWVALVVNLPGMVILVPQVPGYVVALGMNAAVIATLISTLLWLLIMPWLSQLRGLKTLGLTLLIAGCACIFVYSVLCGRSPQQPLPTSLNYMEDVDSQEAWLVSYNTNLNAFNRGVMDRPSDDTRPLASIYPVRRGWIAKTPLLGLAAAELKTEVSTVTDEQGQEWRELTMTIDPRRRNHELRLYGIEQLYLKSVSINGRAQSLYGEGDVQGVFFRTAVENKEPMTIVLRLGEGDLAGLRLIERSHDLPKVFADFPTRSDDMMPVYSDSVTLSQRVLKP